MRALILAAGYATRMYPLTLHQPKSLLPVGPRVVLDWTMESLQRVPNLDEILLVSNAKFAAPFQAWLARRVWQPPVRLVNDGSTSDDNRLGAIRDMLLVVEERPASDALLVTAGDHITEWDLRRFSAFGRAHAPHASVVLYRLPDRSLASRYGIAEVGTDGRLIRCEEKPQQPRSDLAMICLYYLPSPVLPRLRQYLTTGRSADAPGHFIVWLSEQEPVYGWPAEGLYFDIGSVASYQEACAALASNAATMRHVQGGV